VFDIAGTVGGPPPDPDVPARRRIVVVTYYFPPAPSIGAQRWSSMTGHLRAMGHDVTVVSSSAHGSLPDDGARVLRARDLAGDATLRRILRRPNLPSPGAAAPQTPAPAVLTDVVVPDSHLVSWIPAALRSVHRLLRESPVDCLITSGPPDAVHVLALLLGRRRPPWIADFRDGWRFEPLRGPWPTSAQDRLDAWLERRVARTADVVVGATAPIAQDLAARHGADAHWVTNGFEPELECRAGAPAGDPGWRRLVHTGTLSGGWGRDPGPVLAALREFNAGRRDGAPRIRLVLAGRLSVEDEQALAEVDLGAAVEHLGLVDRGTAMGLQREADALLLLTGRNRSEATGKLFEYLASGRPIMALARDNEAARIVRETGTGIAVDGADPAAIRAALEAIADGSLLERYAPRDLERFRYPGPAEAMTELIERARRGRVTPSPAA
jgi:glycosyltransferase involved in cell wall biosynthesis